MPSKMKLTKLNQIRSSCFSSYRAPQFHHIPNSVPTDYYHPISNSDSLSTSLQEYINSNCPNFGLKIHSHILKIGYQPNTKIAIKLLILHLKSGSVRHGRQLLEEMDQPTLSAYNYLLNAYVKHGQVAEAFNLVRRMCDSGLKPDGFTHSLLLKAWGGVPHDSFCLTSDLVKQVHGQIMKYDSEGDDVILFAALIDSYVKSERLGYARRVFYMMAVKNVMCSTSLITGCMNMGFVKDAEALFKEIVQKDVVVYNAMIEGYSKSIDTARKSLEMYIEMRRLNFLPTVSSFLSLIGACSVLTSVNIGQQVQSHLMKSKYFVDVKIGSSLIDMYSKCGSIDDARRIFDYMPEKNIFSWTSMINGYGINGKSFEVIEMFAIMQEQAEIKPNYVTFLCAISACAYAGLVDKGWEIFHSMERDYLMKPQMEHYACIVDLLGRSGRLQQALEFVTRMPEKPSSDVWAALLSSSRLHGELEMANIAADELFKLEANKRPGAYLALSNAMAEAEKWERVDQVRGLMKQRGVAKDTGFSWTDDSIEKYQPGLSFECVGG